ncbi:hypothetical protein [Peptostreptococcus russellii]|uniref:hypothetical protein n=1 Tax=Peptostreptococcus russellii TaxID=215200 RepID=UPI003F58ACB0
MNKKIKFILFFALIFMFSHVNSVDSRADFIENNLSLVSEEAVDMANEDESITTTDNTDDSSKGDVYVDESRLIMEPRLGGGNSPSAGWTVKQRKVTHFGNLNKINKAVNYANALKRKQNNASTIADFAAFCAESTGNTPVRLLSLAFQFLDANGGMITSNINRSYDVILSARKRVQKDGAANVKTVIWYRPANGATIVTYE